MDVKVESHIDTALASSDMAIKRALEMCGLVSEMYAKALCPVGTPESTGIPHYMGGTLRNSITHQVEDKTMMVGTNVEYAPFVEMGTKKMRARPYLKPSIENHIEEYRNIIQEALK